MTELGTSRRRFLRAAAVGIPAAGALAVGSPLTAPAANAAQTSSTPSNQNQNPEAQGAATNAQYLSEKAKNFHILLDMYKQAGDAVDAAQLTQEAQRIRGAADESNSPFPSRPVSWAGVQLERDRMQLAAKINYAAMRAEELADERTRAGGGVPQGQDAVRQAAQRRVIYRVLSSASRDTDALVTKLENLAKGR